MNEERFKNLNIILNQDFSERHDIPQMHFTSTDLRWLMGQSELLTAISKTMGDKNATNDEKIELIETYFEVYRDNNKPGLLDMI